MINNKKKLLIGLLAGQRNVKSIENVKAINDRIGLDINQLDLHIKTPLYTFVNQVIDYEEKKLKVDLFIGHSLGEITAYHLNGLFSFQDTIDLITLRANLMKNCIGNKETLMTAIIPLNYIDALKIAKDNIGNVNSDSQIVFSGMKLDVLQAVKLAKNEFNAKRAINLDVPFAFHIKEFKEHCSLPLLTKAKEILIPQTTVGVISNLDAKLVTDYSKVPEIISKQVYSPVLFKQCIDTLYMDNHVYEFVEFGFNSKTLTNLLPRIDSYANGITKN